MAELSTARPAPLPGFDSRNPTRDDFQFVAARVSGLIEAAALLLNEGGECAAAAWPVLGAAGDLARNLSDALDSIYVTEGSDLK